jgi:hypothetical protein
MNTKLTFYVIATKSYLDYARDLISDLKSRSTEEFKVQVILLTDIGNAFQSEYPKTRFFELITSLIPSYGWPEATLFRFKIMLAHQELAEGEIVAYIDADMRVISSLSTKMFSDPLAKSTDSRIALVKHPGYAFRGRFYHFLIRSRFGPWGINRLSSAWVPRKIRSTYVCGGLFWGDSTSFFQLCRNLDQQVFTDELNGIRAKHNDESHLNRWSASNQHVFMGPEWVYAPGYKNLRHLTPIISVVHKPVSFIRISSSGLESSTSPLRKLLNMWQRFLNLNNHH